MTALTDIPRIDIRRGSLRDVLLAYPEKTRAIIRALRGNVARSAVVTALLPLGDAVSRRWLEKTRNPYRDEIADFAKILNMAGVYTLNLSYEWGCTTGAVEHERGVKLVRVLDWPFPALGENIVVVRQRGYLDDFDNVTWPGVSAVFNAVAKGRFAAAINQAPMRRRMIGGTVLDWARNRAAVWRRHALPPEHLLRRVFESAADYKTAKLLLTRQPVASPVIYTLTGVEKGEGCVIERLEESACVREMVGDRVAATNHFETSLAGEGHGWLNRRDNSGARIEAFRKLPKIDNNFRWFAPPIANSYSRLAMVADARTGALSVRGTAGEKIVSAF